MNINDVHLCPIHTAYETVCRVARELGAEVTGTELIGLIPEDCMVEAGRHFMAGQEGLDELATADELIALAARSMHMDDWVAWDIAERILR